LTIFNIILLYFHRIKTDTPIVITSIGLNAWYRGEINYGGVTETDDVPILHSREDIPEETEVEIRIVRDEGFVLIGSKTELLREPKSTMKFLRHIRLDTPVPLEANRWYRVTFGVIKVCGGLVGDERMYILTSHDLLIN